MKVLGEQPVWSMSGGEMVAALDATYAEIARLKTFALRLIARLETVGHAKEVGAGTTARFLTFRYRIDATEARRDVQLANALPNYPAVAAALPDPASENTTSEGDVLLHPAQAEAIVSALDKLPATVPVEDLAVAEREMVELARTHGPLDLRKAGVQIRNLLDTDGPEPAEQKAYDRETLTLKPADNGVSFNGYLANENAELLRTLIHTHAKPHKTTDGALDPRPRSKRHADALTTILNLTPQPATPQSATARATAGPPAPSTATPSTAHTDSAANSSIRGPLPRPHITVTIDFNDLKAATASATGRLIYGDALSAATIRRLACDAQILPIVLGSDSQPLDVGSTVRLATGPIRKALVARDKGCVCCAAPPIYCDAHHIISWIDGGETKLTNLALLCKRCHRDLHRGHWNINITNGTVHVSRPTWATPNPIPHNNAHPPSPTLRPTTTPHHVPTPQPPATRTAADPTPSTSPPGPGLSGPGLSGPGQSSTALPGTGQSSTALPGTGQSSTDLSSTRSPGAMSPSAASSGAPVRLWPRDTDPPWITPDDTARLDPWGDTSHAVPRPRPHEAADQAPPTTDLNVCGEPLNKQPNQPRNLHHTPTNRCADDNSPTPTPRNSPTPATHDAYDPWADHPPTDANLNNSDPDHNRRENWANSDDAGHPDIHQQRGDVPDSPDRPGKNAHPENCPAGEEQRSMTGSATTHRSEPGEPHDGPAAA
ncbi:hypothetical protein GCM10009804_63860 [Kribbella hippodromi]|uniref:HNH nuclease domain-containing protein n=1 Tax=Kribbella hippodromi TaxID=434347 RepID=A0ABN2E769_9ACTN